MYKVSDPSKRVLTAVFALLLAGTMGLGVPLLAFAAPGDSNSSSEQTSSDAGTVARDQLVEAARKGESVTFWVGGTAERPDYTWTFDGLLLTPAQAQRLAPLELNITLTEKSLSGDITDTLTLDFAWQGVLPIPADIAIRLPVAMADANSLSLYGLDTTGVYELRNSMIHVEDGYAFFVVEEGEPLALSSRDLEGLRPELILESQLAEQANQTGTADESAARPDDQDYGFDSEWFASILPWIIAAVLAVILIVVIVAVIIRQRNQRAAEEMNESFFKDIPSIDVLVGKDDEPVAESD